MLVDVTAKMPDLVEVRNGVYWVPTPSTTRRTLPTAGGAIRAATCSFFEWIESAQADFRGYGDDHGVDRVLEKVARTLRRVAGPACR